MSENNFPKLINGSCDGLGCGDELCWCDEYLAMKEEFQRVVNKPWDRNDIECKHWERAWRFGTSRYEKFYKKGDV